MQSRVAAMYVIVGSLVFSLLTTPASAAVADCANLKSKQCHSEFNATGGSHIDNYMNPKDVQQCILRGFDAPIGCRKDAGNSAGVRVEGSSGFSYGNVQSPENSPGNTGAGSTVSSSSIARNLGFDFNKCSIPGFKNIFCKNGSGNGNENGSANVVKPPAPLIMTDACPEQTDPNQRLGAKTSISASSLSLACGGAVPLTNYETTMNLNPNHLVVTEYKSYYMQVYQKVNNGKYALNPDYWEEFTVMDPPAPLGILIEDKPYPEIQIGPTDYGLLGLKKVDDLIVHHLVTFRRIKRSPTGMIPLPGYLCGVQSFPVPMNPPRLMPVNLKTTELTPTIAQMITYNNQDSINLRLMSRNTIKPIIMKRPAYSIPLPLPWNPRHMKTFPPLIEEFYPPWWFGNMKDGKSEHLLYFWPEPPEEEIEADEKFLMLPIFQGLPVVPIRQESPFAPAPVCGLESKFFGKPGKMSGDILLEQPTTLCEGSDEECAAMKKECELAKGDDCDTITNKPANDLSCETTKLPLKSPAVPLACNGKMQWVVLDRHNMVYPPGTNVTPIAIDGRTALMMPTIKGTRIFAQKDSNIRLGKDAPQIILEEGGTLLLSKDAGRIKMLPPATIDVVQLNKNTTGSSIYLDGGGMWIDNNGGLKETYPKGYHLVAPDPVLPYVVNLNRSFTVPESYEYPSRIKDEDKNIDPYVKLPLDADPEPEITVFKPGMLPSLKTPRAVFPLTLPTPTPVVRNRIPTAPVVIPPEPSPRQPTTRGPR